MLQRTEPCDDSSATGTAYSMRDFLQFVFEHVGLEWQKYVKFDERYLRPSEVDSLTGDASRATSVLGWRPRVLAPELARIMVEADRATA